MFFIKNPKVALPLLVLSSGLFSHLALAQTGEAVVNFVGTIQEAGCQIDPSTKDQTIDFGTIGANYFSTTNPTHASTQPINIKLTNCPASISKAKIVISGTAASTVSTGNYLLAINSGAGAATGLAILFMDSNNVQIKLNQISDPGQPLVAGDNTLHYFSSLDNITYDAYLTVTPGTINATATYSITYE